MSILVIGRSGQLAREIARQTGNSNLALRFAGRPELDLGTPGAARTLIAAERPELIINTAAFTAVDRAETEPKAARRVNADAAAEIAAAAAHLGAPIIHVSTDYVFDGNGDCPYDENSRTGPRNVYGATKLAGEQGVAAANPQHFIVRTSWLVSPFGQNFVRTMLRLGGEREEIRVVADQIGRPTAAANLARALLKLSAQAGTATPGLYHLAGGGDPASWADLAELVMAERSRVLGSAARIRRVPASDYPTPAERPKHSVLDCSKAKRNLGLVLPDWRDTIPGLVREVLSVARSSVDYNEITVGYDPAR